jgi:cbb3-type cytochrome oxidase subunit 3
MIYSDLLGWWTISIIWCAIFLIAVSLYLYWDRRKRYTEGTHVMRRTRIRDFVFVWILVGLLALYIVSIYRESSIVFAAGNILVEAILVLYIIARRPK